MSAPIPPYAVRALLIEGAAVAVVIGIVTRSGTLRIGLDLAAAVFAAFVALDLRGWTGPARRRPPMLLGADGQRDDDGAADLIADADGLVAMLEVVPPGTVVATASGPPPVLNPGPETRRGAPTVTRGLGSIGGRTVVTIRVRADGPAWHPDALRTTLASEIARTGRKLAAVGITVRRLTDLGRFHPADLADLAAPRNRAAPRDRATPRDGTGGELSLDHGVELGRDRRGDVLTARVLPGRSTLDVVVLGVTDLAGTLAVRARAVGVPLRLSVLDPAGGADPGALRSADLVICGRLAPPEAAAVASALGLSATTASWLDRIDDGMAAVIADGTVRWVQIGA